MIATIIVPNTRSRRNRRDISPIMQAVPVVSCPEVEIDLTETYEMGQVLQIADIENGRTRRILLPTQDDEDFSSIDGDFSNLEMQRLRSNTIPPPLSDPCRRAINNAIQASQDKPKIKFAYPFVTFTLVIAIWCVFLVAVSQSTGLDSMTLSDPVAPANDAWWYMTVSYYPQCTDLRSQFYRIFSSQFVHVGLMHIGGNTLCIVLYGLVIECFLPWGHLWVLAIFQWAMINGALGFSLAFPYNGLVGASPGLYGLIGACWTTAIMNRDLLPGFVAFCLPGTLLIQLVMDIVVYEYQYDSDLAYVAHAFGMVSGFALSAAISAAYRPKPRHWCRIVYAVFGGALLIIVIGFLLSSLYPRLSTATVH